MRTSERLRGLKKWLNEEACKGREMKAPGKKMDLGQIITVEPTCYLAWAPSRLDKGQFQTEAETICPGLLIMPKKAFTKYTEEKRFDRYSNIHRPQEMGQHLSVDILFSVYEPGIRLPGFVVLLCLVAIIRFPGFVVLFCLAAIIRFLGFVILLCLVVIISLPCFVVLFCPADIIRFLGFIVLLRPDVIIIRILRFWSTLDDDIARSPASLPGSDNVFSKALAIVVADATG